jgi:DNA polymerase-3 subunit epsilon
LPILKSKSLESLIQHFDIHVETRHRALDDARATAFLLNHFIEQIENKFDVETLDDLLTFQNKRVYQIKKPPKNFLALKETLQNLPELPGVYSYYDKKDELIYIGKAKSLKDRVNSYFYHNTSHSKKIFDLVREVRSIKYEVTGTELSALLLEAKSIRKKKPFYNSAQKRYKKYPFLKINLALEYPYLEWNYDIKNDGAEYFGPFVSRYHVESFIDILNKIFLIRECKNKDVKEKERERCIYPDLKRCSAPCQNGDKDLYWTELNKIIEFLQGKNNDLLKKFEDMMGERAENKRFEEAAELRDKIKMIKFFIERHQHLPPSIHKSNYIVIVPSYRTSFEIFFIKKGKVLHSEVFKHFDEDKITALLENSYSSSTLFDYDNTFFEPSFMQILIGWIYKNFDDIKIINITEDKGIKEIIPEIKMFLER